MAKREFLMLAHKYEPRKHSIFGWFESEKLDGLRCFWDGGVSRGMAATRVPWANTVKDGRYINPPVATGLWTRYGKVISAPAFWLDSLPPFPLDGELYAGRGQFQTTMSIVKTINPDIDLWNQIRYAVFDSPGIDVVFKDSTITFNASAKFSIKGSAAWVRNQEKEIQEAPIQARVTFQVMAKWLETLLEGNKVAFAHQQTQLPFTTTAAIAQIERRLEEVISVGGEGLILRRHTSMWVPERSHELLKFKPFNDDEAVVTGYTWGRETDKGSKLLGMMGALILNYGGKTFELSGFTESERGMTFHPFPGQTDVNVRVAQQEPFNFPGQRVSRDWHNPMFPIGSTVTFRYRELTDDGIPKEARYLRKA